MLAYNKNRVNRHVKNKLIVILGQTSSGKTDLSIKLALRLSSGQTKKIFSINGVEIISADSRQIYKGMDIGSGKVTKKEMQGVPHHLLSVANPKRKFTAAQYQKLAFKKIKEMQKRGKIPVLVGGTGFYIQSVIDGIAIPKVKPDWKLRKKLEKFGNEELFKKLKKLDPKRAEAIDKNNPRRLIRALEIVLKTGKPVHGDSWGQTMVCPWSVPGLSPISVLEIGIKKTPEELKKLIKKRLLKRLKNNAMINEVKKLKESGLSWKRLEEFGLEYRFVAQYLQNKISYQKMTDKIQKESERYAKRQMTWFKRDSRIKWVKNYKEAEKLVKSFINKG